MATFVSTSVHEGLENPQINSQRVNQVHRQTDNIGTEVRGLLVDELIAEGRRATKRGIEDVAMEKTPLEFLDFFQGTSKKRKKKKHATQPSKNALMQLNELRPGLEFVMSSQEGPPHDPTFAMSVSIDGCTFEGRGPSKQKAKHDAAEKVLSFVLQNPLLREENLALMQITAPAEDTCSFVPMNTLEASVIKPEISAEMSHDKHPVMFLNELHQGQPLDYQFERDTTAELEFICTVEVNGQEFTGSGLNKRKAKMVAAHRALFTIHNISMQPVGTALTTGSSLANAPAPPPLQNQLPQHVADRIAQMTSDKFKKLTCLLGDQGFRRKVLAGIVMTTHRENLEIQYQMVSIGTGTKFISGEYISEKGYAINDCHGEIIARRGLRRFLFSQLEANVRGETESSILEKQKSGLFGLKSGIEFHLYISTSPCGDARVFSPHESEADEVDRHAGRKKRGLLRVKIENGEGTIPVANSATQIQTWDGVLGSEKLCTMSCSDKVSKWNVLGIQGALLSNFMEPIYLNSITLGSLFRFDHMSRATYTRLGSITGLPKHYRQNQPIMSGLTFPESRLPGKAPKNSVNWTVGDESLENINTLTGKLSDTTQPSRLCKQAMFARFCALWSKIHPSKKPPVIYHDAKLLSNDYQSAKTLMVRAFESNGLGTWMKKPGEQDWFDMIGAP